MPIDFAKLNDPEWQAAAKAEREAEAAKLQAAREAWKQQVSVCLDNEDNLNARERSLVNSCRFALAQWQSLSAAQEKWLKDIAARFS